MPVSGSYYYPGLNKANTSFRSIDIGTSTAFPPGSSGVGKLVITGSGADMGAFLITETGAVRPLDGVTPPSFNGDLSGSVLRDLAGQLTLSSSVNSLVAISGGIEFVVPDSNIVARNTHLTLSSSAGSVIMISGTMTIANTGSYADPAIKFGENSVGSASRVGIRYENASITIGGVVTESNAWQFRSGSLSSLVPGGPMLLNIPALAGVPNFVISGTHNTGMGILSDHSVFFTCNGTDQIKIDQSGTISAPSSHLILSSSAGSKVVVSGTLTLLGPSPHLLAPSSHLILSSSVNSTVTVSGNLSFPVDGARITATNSNLVLSSSAGSQIVISGVLNIAETGSYDNPAFAIGRNLAGFGIDMGIYTKGSALYVSSRQDETKAWSFETGSFGSVSQFGPRMRNVGAAPGVPLFVMSGADNLGMGFDSTDHRIIFTVGGVDQVSVRPSGTLFAPNSHLVLSSSGGSVIAVSGTLTLVDNTGKINALNSDLVLSSSAGSIIAISGVLSLPEPRPVINAKNGHLILSSSAGSVVMISGGLQLPTGSFQNPALKFGSNVAAQIVYADGADDLIIQSANDQTSGWKFDQYSLTSVSPYGPLLKAVATSATVPIFVASGSERTGIGFADNDHVSVIGNSTEIVRFSPSGSITATSTHLILSSSVSNSIIRMSGTLSLHSLTTATLPAGSDALSGSIVWLTDVKCAVIYGPEGWTRILTGTL